GKEGDNYFLVNSGGKLVTESFYNKPEIIEGLINLRTCYIDVDSNIIIDHDYKDGFDFNRGLAEVGRENETIGEYERAYINKAGELVGKWFEEISRYNGKFYWGKKITSIEFYDKNGYVIPCYDAKICHSKKMEYQYGMFDGTGKMTAGWFDEIGVGPDLKDNCVWGVFRILDYYADSMMAIRVGDKWGFIHWNGNIVIKPNYEKVKNFYKEYAFVRSDNLWSVIDKTGEKQTGAWSDVFDSEQEICRVIDNDMYMYVDYKGEQIIDDTFEYAAAFDDENVTYVVKNGRMYFIDRNGDVVDIDISAHFGFRNGSAIIHKNRGRFEYDVVEGDKVFSVNEKGELISGFSDRIY
ncbi:MAG: WG repeat-containing protein, partial [Bacteroidota bacterium]